MLTIIIKSKTFFADDFVHNQINKYYLYFFRFVTISSNETSSAVSLLCHTIVCGDRRSVSNVRWNLEKVWATIATQRTAALSISQRTPQTSNTETNPNPNFGVINFKDTNRYQVLLPCMPLRSSGLICTCNQFC